MISAIGRRVAQLDPVGRQVVHALQRTAPTLAQLHHRADVVVRGEHGRPDHGLEHLGHLAGRVLARVGHGELGPVVEHHPVDHVGRGGDEVQVGLALQPLADDLQVEQPEEAAPETEAERGRRLGLVVQRRVVELQLVQRVTQIRVVRAVDRVQPE
jgi:hypothetical protein